MRWHLVGAVIQVACLGLDWVAGEAVLPFGLAIRLALVVPLYVAAAWLLARGPRALGTASVIVPMVVATGAVALLGAMAPQPFSDRYIMAAGMIPLFGIILMPVSVREAAILAGCALPVYAVAATGGWLFGHAGQVADLVVFMSVLVTIGLGVRRRLARVELANQRLRQLDHERAEELAALARKLEILSNTDSLTGLDNRRGFDLVGARLCREAVETGGWLGLVMIDVDHFKSFNDAGGHLAGDVCLRGLAAALLAACRLDRHGIARLGGEEFVVLFPGLSPEETEQRAERLRRAAIGAAIPHPGRGHSPVTVSVGAAALRPVSVQALNELLAIADAALYDAKAAGRNRTVLGLPGFASDGLTAVPLLTDAA